MLSRKCLKRSNQALGACSRPYRALFNRHTITFSYSSHCSNPGDWIMYTSSVSSPWRNILLTSTCRSNHLWVRARVRIIWIVGGLTIWLNVSWKSNPRFLGKPFAINRALYLAIDPSEFLLILNNHLHPTRILPPDRVVKHQVLLMVRTFNSSLI